MTEMPPQQGPDGDRAVVEAQIQLIVDDVPDLEVVRTDTDEIAYLARAGHLLVRTEYVERLPEVLPGRVVQAREAADGLVLYAYGNPDADEVLMTVEQALETVDGARQAGTFGADESRDDAAPIATPDHFLHFVASVGGHCPATEPEPVPADSDPSLHSSKVDPHDGDGVLVWVLDSGLLCDADAHPWLVGVTGGMDDPYDPRHPGEERIAAYAGHGTFCAGMVRVVAPAARVHVARTFVRVYDRNGSAADVQTHTGFYESDLAEHVTAALAADADVLSLAFGTHTRRNLPLLSIDGLAGQLGRYPHVALVAAAGNDQSSVEFWPAAYQWVTSVGALDKDWQSRAGFTNHGLWVKVYAPGEDLVNAYVSRGTLVCNEPPNVGQRRDFEGMARWSGTSFATPLVAGLIARRMSQTGESAQQAAAQLVADAENRPGVGMVVLP